jgi:hypothetical protein
MLFRAFGHQNLKEIKKNTTSERSVSQIHRVMQRLVARSRGTPAMLILPMLFGAREKQLKGWRRSKKLSLMRTINPEFKDLAQTDCILG